MKLDVVQLTQGIKFNRDTKDATEYVMAADAALTEVKRRLPPQVCLAAVINTRFGEDWTDIYSSDDYPIDEELEDQLNRNFVSEVYLAIGITSWVLVGAFCAVRHNVELLGIKTIHEIRDS